jgi:hypothetical protein
MISTIIKIVFAKEKFYVVCNSSSLLTLKPTLIIKFILCQNYLQFIYYIKDEIMNLKIYHTIHKIMSMTTIQLSSVWN